jgi:membrane protein implicated in regulation of membrane protease activity
MNSVTLGLRVAGTIFGLMCLAHLGRIALQIQLEIAGYDVPLWLNGVGLLITAFLCAWLWRLSLAARSPGTPPATS